ncbi:MAG: putative MATE family efflux protein [Alteromonadaceae bacterium]|jgi:putative MATE family efflux protein
MKDLTQGSIPKHLITMALPMMIGMFVQTLYFLVDLYFVGKLGGAALAGLSLAGNAMFMIFALTQVLNVGTAAVVSHAVGRKDKAEANLTFNQSLMLASIVGIIVCIAGYLGAETYLNLVSNDSATVKEGLTYLYWFIPCMALQFPMVAMSAALRGTGIVKPVMIIQMFSVCINIVFSPILIAGWGTGYAMGIAGAGLSSSISVVFAVLLIWYYFKHADKYISIELPLWQPNSPCIKRILAIGFPSGGEFFLMFAYMSTIYSLIQQFGPDAQAGFGLGSRIMQSLFLPAMAIAFAAPAIAGQNFGAKKYQRVRDTFTWATILTCSMMLILTLVCVWQAPLLLQDFSNDKNVLLFSVTFLQIICFNFIPSGLVFTCSGLFQAMGNTWPALISTATRLASFVIPALWLSQQQSFEISQLWYISVATVCLQACISFYLLRREFAKRLPRSIITDLNEQQLTT